MTFFIKVCINYLNSSLLKGKAVGARAMTRAKAKFKALTGVGVTSRVGPRVEIREQTSKIRREPLHLVKALGETLAS